MNNVTIKNCGTGIKSEAPIDMEATNMNFIYNDKDMDLMIDDKHDVIFESISSVGCKTESITLRDYSRLMDDVKELIKNKKLELTKKETEEMEYILNELKKEKGNKTKTKKLLQELYDVSKTTTTSIIIHYISSQLGILTE